ENIQNAVRAAQKIRTERIQLDEKIRKDMESLRKYVLEERQQSFAHKTSNGFVKVCLGLEALPQSKAEDLKTLGQE
ncbi:unnamed protein product, partial [Oikopleura dioica]